MGPIFLVWIGRDWDEPFSWYSSSLNHAWHMRPGKDSIQGDDTVLDNGPMGPIFLVWIGQTHFPGTVAL